MTATHLVWHDAEVIKRVSLDDSYLLLTLRHPPAFNHIAGQYTVFKLSDGSSEYLYSFSVASRPRADRALDFCIAYKEGSQLKNLLAAHPVGSTLPISDAQGDLTLGKLKDKPLVFVAGGSGIAPVRAMLQEIFERPALVRPIALVYGCRDAAVVPYLSEIQDLARHKALPLRVWIGAEKGQAPGIENGRVTEGLRKSIIPDADYMVCGPTLMVEACCHVLAEEGIKSQHIHFEKYG